MRPDNNTLHYQPKLALTHKPLGEKLPENNRVRCRELLIQLLRSVALNQPLPASQRRTEHE